MFETLLAKVDGAVGQLTLNRLSEYFDVDREDRWSLLDAVTESDMPPVERQAVTALLELEANTDSRAPMDRYRLREAYWSAKNTLRYLEGRKKP